MAAVSPAEMIRDTVNGLIAFVVPGPDVYSVAQGASSDTPGGIDANVTDLLIDTLDKSRPFPVAKLVAGVLNDVAKKVNPAAEGPFPSLFARLSYAEKAKVFEIIEGLDAFKFVAGLLPIVVARAAYSEAGVYDVATRTLTGRPLGWDVTHYEGVADGRDEFIGYLDDRDHVEG